MLRSLTINLSSFIIAQSVSAGDYARDKLETMLAAMAEN